ncbi:MAG: hypothetical protein ACC608_06605 [Anaerofustis sp.]
MKRHVAFFILWDALFAGLLWLFGYLSDQLSVGATNETRALSILLQLAFCLLFGGLFAWLIHFGGAFIITAKYAVTEFLLIGLPALYLAGFTSIAYLLSTLWASTALILAPIWLLIDILPALVGGVLFGYELIVLFARLKKCRSRGKNTADYVVE